MTPKLNPNQTFSRASYALYDDDSDKNNNSNVHTVIETQTLQVNDKILHMWHKVQIIDKQNQ